MYVVLNFLFHSVTNAQSVLQIADRFDRWLTNIEQSLIQQHGITTDLADLHRQINEILVLEKEYTNTNRVVRKLKSTMSKKFSKGGFVDVKPLLERWEAIEVQLVGRKKELLARIQDMSHLKQCIASENWWLNISYRTLKEVSVLPESVDDCQKLLIVYQVCLFCCLVNRWFYEQNSPASRDVETYF